VLRRLNAGCKQLSVERWECVDAWFPGCGFGNEIELNGKKCLMSQGSGANAIAEGWHWVGQMQKLHKAKNMKCIDID